jgi:hypothetical protein
VSAPMQWDAVPNFDLVRRYDLELAFGYDQFGQVPTVSVSGEGGHSGKRETIAVATTDPIGDAPAAIDRFVQEHQPKEVGSP